MVLNHGVHGVVDAGAKEGDALRVVERDAVLIHECASMCLPGAATAFARGVLHGSVGGAAENARAHRLKLLGELGVELAAVVREDVVGHAERNDPQLHERATRCLDACCQPARRLGAFIATPILLHRRFLQKCFLGMPGGIE